MEKINAIRGMNDILPEEVIYWQKVENQFRQVTQQFGYQEIRFPLVEKTELFKRSIGEATDIVEKEMYTFLDRNQDSLTLRPEGTASCVRAGIEHGLFYHQTQRLWYLGPCFRYERPQKGRYRQFHHFGVEAFGLAGPDIDAELIVLAATLLEKFKLLPHVTLELNSMGSPDARKHYREQLVQYFANYRDQLDEDCQRRLTTNPLRILDSKNPAMHAIIQNAPQITEYLSTEDQDHFSRLRDLLDCAGVAYVINPCLVRGLDYYTRTVFEWTTQSLGAQGTVCGGGRYDGLIEQLGGAPSPALGFAIGLERLILLLQQIETLSLASPHIYFLTDSPITFGRALALTKPLRDDFRVSLHCGGSTLKNQFKKADKSGAQVALILAEQEHQQGQITIKFLRHAAPQVTIPQIELMPYLKQKVKEGVIMLVKNVLA